MRGGADPLQAARGGQVLQQELPVLRRSARGGDLGSERAVRSGRGDGAPRRPGLWHRLRAWRQGAGADHHRHLRASQHRHPGAFLAAGELFRLPQVLGLQARTPAQGQGRALPWPHHQVPRQEHRHQAWVVLRRRPQGLFDRRGQAVHLPAGAALRRHLQHRSVGGGLGPVLAAGRGRMPRRILCEPHPHRPGRYPRQRPASGLARRHARVLRVPQPVAAWGQADPGRYLGSLRLHPLHQDAGSAVCRSDQGAAVVAPELGVCLRCGEGCLQPLPQQQHRAGGAAGRALHLQRPAPDARRQDGGAQEDYPGPGPARQTHRLWLRRSHAGGAVPGGGWLRGRQRQAGAGSRVPGHHAPARQDPEHLGGGGRSGACLAGGARYFGGHRARSRLQRSQWPALRQGVHPGGCGLGRSAHRHPALRPVCEALPRPGGAGARLCGHAAPVSYRYR